MAATRFQRRQPGGLEVRGVSRQRISSPEALEIYENSRINPAMMSNNNASLSTRKMNENLYTSSQENIFAPNALELPPPIITPPLASPSPDSDMEARGGPADWTTGAMTERSSVSWMDEFDKQTTKTVERMFREIDYALYESRETSHSQLHSTSENLGQECEDWSSSFPHMRVVGQTLNTPNSSMNKYRERQTSTPILMGFQERAPRSPSSDDDFDNKDAEAETVFAVDGKGADVVRAMALAAPAHDDSRRSLVSLPSTLHSNRSRIAPSLATGTPILRTREDLIRQLTWEAIWPVVARCIRPLLMALKAEKVQSMYGTPAPDLGQQAMMHVTMPHSPTVVTGRMAQPRAMGASGIVFTGQSPLSRNLSGQMSQTSTNNGEAQRMLGNLLLISSKQINNRRQDIVVDPIAPLQFQPVQPLQPPPAPLIIQPPAPSIASMSQNPSRVATSQQQRPTSGMRVPSASTRGRLGRGRLHPLDRPKTPSQAQQDDQIFDGLRGQKLHTAAELQQQPVYRPQQSAFSGGLPLPKNSPLPPLHHSYAGMASSGVGALPAVIGTAQSTGDFLSVAPVMSRATVQRTYVPSASRAPSAAIGHERPPPTFRMASDIFGSGSGLSSALGARSVLGPSQANYVLNRSNTLLNVTGVGVMGQLDEFDRIVASGPTGTARAPATAIGINRASLVNASFAGSPHK